MSKRAWNWISLGTIAGLLFTLTACGNKDKPQPQANNKESKPEAVVIVDQSEAMSNRGVPLPEWAGKIADPASIRESSEPIIGEIRFYGVKGRQSSIKEQQFLHRLSKIRGEGNIFQRDDVADFDGLVAGKAGGQQPGFVNGEQPSTENYQPIFDNPYKLVKNDPLSTFSSSVDTASYSNLRARLNAGQLPHKDAVRIADMLNYFNYDYPVPKNDAPVAFHLEIAPCPWQPKHHLLRIGLKAKTIDKEKMPPRNLVFLIDTSGSMNEPNRLPLVQQSLRLLVNELTVRDRVSIVTYAGSADLLLPPTPGSEKDTITRTIDRLNASGSTNGGGGIHMAYEQAKASFIKDGVNRVILATDGDFNVGVSSDAELVRIIEQKRETGVYLTVLGYGMGNLKDSKLEQLAHHGNGHYAYIDSLDEAKKVFVEQGGSLVTVAKDVKLQVEFNPAKVAGYRLIGYENRVMRNEDFRDDKKDAGDMGSGHTCTALYEIVPVGEKVESGDVEPLKYQTTPKLSDAAKSGEWATVRMRYKHPDTDKAQEVEAALPAEALGKNVTNDFEFAAAAASFGMLLRESEYKGIATYGSVLESAQALLRDKKDPHREEFVKLVRVALTVEQAKKGAEK